MKIVSLCLSFQKMVLNLFIECKVSFRSIHHMKVHIGAMQIQCSHGSRLKFQVIDVDSCHFILMHSLQPLRWKVNQALSNSPRMDFQLKHNICHVLLCGTTSTGSSNLIQIHRIIPPILCIPGTQYLPKSKDCVV